MRLQRLLIDSLPGIQPGYEFRPAGDGVNLVTGPNAIGKSSLARALRYLLAGKQRDDPLALSLEADFLSRDGDERWTVRRQGNEIFWSRNGEPTAPPSLPTAAQFSLYRLAMEHLLADDQEDKTLAREMRNQLRGGFDLGRPRIALRPRFAHTEAGKLRDARRKREEIERSYAEIRRQEAELPDLDSAIKEAERAAADRDQLEQALALEQAIRDCRGKQERLAGFPPDMERLLGDEIKRLQDQEKKAEESRNELRCQEERLEVCQANLAGAGLSDGRPTDEELETNRRLLQELKDKERERDDVRRARTDAEAEIRNALGQLGGREEGREPPKLDAASVQQGEEIVRPLLEARQALAGFEQKYKQTPEAPAERDIERWRDGMIALRDWLAADAATSGDEQTSNKRRPPWVSWLALVAGLVAALFAAFAASVAAASQVAVSAVIAALSAAVVAGATIWTLLSGRRTDQNSPAKKARLLYEETSLPMPDEWNQDNVRKLLQDEIEPQLNKLLLQREQAAGRSGLEADIEQTRAEIEALKAKKNAFADKCGFDPELPLIAFDRFIRHAVAWDAARLKYERQQAELAQLDLDMEQTAAQIRDFLASWNQGGASSSSPSAERDAPDRDQDDADIDDAALASAGFDSLDVHFQALDKRVKDAEKHRREVESCEREIQSARRQMADVKSAMDDIFQGVGLTSEQRRELDDRLERRDDWKQAQEARRDAEVEVARLSRLLSEREDLITSAESGATAQLNEELDDATRKAERLEELQKEETQIRTRIEDAGKRRDLERSLAAEAGAREALEDKRERALLHEATAVLLDDVEQRFQAENEPDLLCRARELFAEVTEHAFELRIGSEDAFTAWDNIQGEARSLSELSSGTRMQLLLALRLAWTEHQERNSEPLPLFLDEALTTSDEHRFAVMAKSLERLSEKQGRQVFYLCARRHERALWAQATGKEPPMVDLAALRFADQGPAAEDLALPAAPSLPAPDDLSPEDYGALIAVPYLDPRASAQSIHIFYLLRDDLKLLHLLLDTWRIGALGQLQALLASSAAEGAIADPRPRQRLQHRCRAARIWVELWRQGRGRPVDRGVLEQSGAISNVFIDKVAEVAASLQGDGEGLLDALRQRVLLRFHQSKTNELARWLADEGYTDDRTPLNREQRLRATLQQAAPEDQDAVADIRQLVRWLEAAVEGSSRGSVSLTDEAAE